MKSFFRNIWDTYHPRSNVLWISYLLESLTKRRGEVVTKFLKKKPATKVPLDNRKRIAETLYPLNECGSAEEVMEFFMTDKDARKLLQNVIN